MTTITSTIRPERIRAARNAMGWTQQQLADWLKVSQAQVHEWETVGVPSRGTAGPYLEIKIPELETMARKAEPCP